MKNDFWIFLETESRSTEEPRIYGDRQEEEKEEKGIRLKTEKKLFDSAKFVLFSCDYISVFTRYRLIWLRFQEIKAII